MNAETQNYNFLKNELLTACHSLRIRV